MFYRKGERRITGKSMIYGAEEPGIKWIDTPTVRAEALWSTLVMYLFFFWKFPWSCDHGGYESWLGFTSQLNPLKGTLSFLLFLASEINTHDETNMQMLLQSPPSVPWQFDLSFFFSIAPAFTLEPPQPLPLNRLIPCPWTALTLALEPPSLRLCPWTLHIGLALEPPLCLALALEPSPRK